MSRNNRGLTIRYRQALVLAFSICVFGQSGSLRKRGRHVQDRKDGIESGRFETGERLFEDVESGEEAVVTDDVGLDRSDEIDSGRVVAVDGTGDVGNGDVGSEVGG